MTLQARIRELLRTEAAEDGMLPAEIANELEAKLANVHAVLATMEAIDAYIDRWVAAKCPGGYSPVWMVTPAPPPSAPKPEPREPRKWPT